MKVRALLSFLYFFFIVATGKGQDKYAVVREKGVWKVIDAYGAVITDNLVSGEERICGDCFSEGMISYTVNGKFGFKDLQGRTVVPPTYRSVQSFNNGFAVVIVAKTPRPEISDYSSSPRLLYKYGLLNKKGQLVVDTTYDYISDVDSCGVSVAVANDKISLIYKDGRVTQLPYQTQRSLWPIPAFVNGLLPVLVNYDGQRLVCGFEGCKVGFIDRSGRLVIDTVYELTGATGDHSEDMQNSRLGGARAGAALVSSCYLKQAYYAFDGDRSVVRKNGNNIVINSRGDALFTIKADAGEIRNIGGFLWVDPNPRRNPFYINYVDVKADKILFDKNGTQIKLPAEFEPHSFRQGYLVLFKRNAKVMGLIYPDGRLVSDIEYQYIIPNACGYAQTDRGFIDSLGQPVQASSANNYRWLNVRDKRFVLSESTEKKKGYENRGIMNMKGKWVIPPEYYSVEGPINGFFIARKAYPINQEGGMYGYFSEKGKKVTELKYESASQFYMIQ